MEETFGYIVGPVNQANTTSGFCGEADFVPPQGLAVLLEVREYDVYRFAKILGGAPLRTTLAQGCGEALKRSSDVAQ